MNDDLDNELAFISDEMDPMILEEDPLIPKSRKHTRTRVQPVTIQQARSGPWSNNAQLGYRVPFNMDANFRQTVLKLDEWGPPEVWTVMLGLTYSEDSWPAANNFLGITAEIQIGTGGTSQDFEVDWLQGTCLSVPMNALNVTARYAVAGVPIVPADLSLSVLLARGGRAGGMRPKFTEQEAIAANTAGIYHRIPNFCHRVQILPAVNVASAVDLYNPNSFLNFGTGPAPVTGYGFVLGSQLLAFPDGVPVPGNSHNVRFTNNTLNQVRLSWLYYLQL